MYADIILDRNTQATIAMSLSIYYWKAAKTNLINWKNLFVKSLERKLEMIGYLNKEFKETEPPSWADLRCDPNVII